jgi:hypothetical protein
MNSREKEPSYYYEDDDGGGECSQSSESSVIKADLIDFKSVSRPKNQASTKSKIDSKIATERFVGSSHTNDHTLDAMFDTNQGLQLSIETRSGLQDFNVILNQSLKIRDGEEKMSRPLEAYHADDYDAAYQSNNSCLSSSSYIDVSSS